MNAFRIPCKVHGHVGSSFRASSAKGSRAISVGQTADWDASQYLRFADERTRPSRDLVAAIPLQNPKNIIDLGCGPANSTAVLASRYPSSRSTRIRGIDSSPDMLRKAREVLPAADFELADLAIWEPPQGNEAADLLFTNATLQWLPAELILPIIEKWVKSQPSGGVFAMQVPDNVTEPSHVLMAETASAGPWAGLLSQKSPGRSIFPRPNTLYDRMQPLCRNIDIWHTYYQHRLDGHEAIVSWFKQSGLRPYLQPLEKDMQKTFLQNYLESIKAAYPLNKDGSVLLRFPRLFMVCVRS
ncbi:putative O-methyltransferase [Pseudovirgaria hyperparasitica]|uniref:Putative O-methyltransferase n=1 Tax=Pseudovirgaria hyperparasitica TaxID=470096 RepID=A0A6A6VW49_9PEZI|nr:putative O-methyltransferase [Pseudovirgaria hyperparasitica]KAF2753870.1 putative O-methyltransferase [Pseudovirgaria hyperparasitica]